MYCKICGSEIKDDAKFCENCGESQTNGQNLNPMPAQPIQPSTQFMKQTKSKRRRKGCFDLFLILLIALLVAAILGFGNKKINKSTTNNNELTSNITESKTNNKKYNVSINSAKVEQSGESLYLVVEYNFTNNDTYAISFNSAFDVFIYQNGVQCLDYELWRDESDRHQERAKIQPGTTYQVRQAYRLYDKVSPVKYEIKGGAMLDIDTYASGTINIK